MYAGGHGNVSGGPAEFVKNFGGAESQNNVRKKIPHLGKGLAIISIYSKIEYERRKIHKGRIMAQKVYTVEGRQFRTEGDYARAKHDKEIIDRLRAETNFKDRKAVEALRDGLRGGKYKFLTLLGQDFQEEVEGILAAVPAGRKSKGRALTAKAQEKGSTSQLRRPEQPEKGGAPEQGRPGRGSTAASRMAGRQEGGGVSAGTSGQGRPYRQTASAGAVQDKQASVPDSAVEEVLLRQERRRKLILRVSSVLAVICLGYFGVYSYYNYQSENAFAQLLELKDRPLTVTPAPQASTGPLFTLDDAPEEREVLDEYKNLLINNKSLIGWLKIDDTNINYPVMQTENNEYYLDHNVNEEYDINGSIFLDKDCDVVNPSTNYILYGHHMRNGRMFGKLDYYQRESYYKEHPYISFDTIYEKGTYQVMYVFRSKVYKESEIVFKYYQFIDANSEQEFDSYMKEMADMSLYDTGVTAQYGDQLLTLSTCDYQETDGRFVVVAKKIAKE